jgi:hypothetical protein
MHPNVSAAVYVAAPPRCGRGLAGPGKDISDATGDRWDRVRRRRRLSENAFLRDFAGNLPEAKARVLYAVQ